jgi:hypothetical protein
MDDPPSLLVVYYGIRTLTERVNQRQTPQTEAIAVMNIQDTQTIP